MNTASKDFIASRTYSLPVSLHQKLRQEALDREISASERLRQLVALGIRAEAEEKNTGGTDTAG